MPGIPTRPEFRAPTPDLPQLPRMDPGTAGAAWGQMAQGAAQFGDMIAQHEHRNAQFDYAIGQAERAVQLAKVKSESEIALRTKADEIASDPNWQAAENAWKTFLDDARTAQKERIVDPAVYQAWETHFNQSAVMRSLDIKGAVRKRRLDGLVTGLDDTLFNLGQAAGRASSPEDRALVMNEVEIALGDAVGFGAITGEDAGKRRRGFMSHVDETDARRLIARDPEGAAVAILDDRRFPNLDTLKRTQLADTAQRRADSLRAERVRQWDKAERDAERAVKKAVDGRLRAFWTSEDPAEQQKIYQDLSAVGDPEALHRMREHMAKGGSLGEDNQYAVMDLERRIREGRVGSMADLFGEVGRGVGAQTMRERIVPLFDATQKQGFGLAMRYIQTSLGIPENSLIGDAQKEAALRVGQAQAEMLALHAKAPDRDWFSEAERVATKYRAVVSKDTAARLPILRRQYEKAVQAGDVNKAADTKASIDSLIIQMGGTP